MAIYCTACNKEICNDGYTWNEYYKYHSKELGDNGYCPFCGAALDSNAEDR